MSRERDAVSPPSKAMMGDFDPDIRSDLVDSWSKRIENQLLAAGNVLIDVRTSRMAYFSHGGKYAIMWEEIMSALQKQGVFRNVSPSNSLLWSLVTSPMKLFSSPRKAPSTLPTNGTFVVHTGALQVLSQRVMEWALEDCVQEDSCFRPYPLFTITEIVPILGSRATEQDVEIVVEHMKELYPHKVHRRGDLVRFDGREIQDQDETLMSVIKAYNKFEKHIGSLDHLAEQERIKAKECARTRNKTRGMAHIRRMKSIQSRVDRLVEFQTNLQSTLLAHSDAVYGGEMMESLNSALLCLRDAGKKVNVDDAEKVRDEFFAVASKMEDVWKVMDGMREDQEALDDERKSAMDDVDSDLLDEFKRLEEDVVAESEQRAKAEGLHSKEQRGDFSHEMADMEGKDGKEERGTGLQSSVERVKKNEEMDEDSREHDVTKKMEAMEL
eukprot:TRINITY_DN686_c0_g1_i3.p1 TRINITY_DN686_c0_g1~~TRINITY_DN686_c0_g1_i3.p1  ORF type:complete len:440 (-),score=160.06 TRINITY_DN686_c0_g1_i3:1186-2505(-)